MLHFQNLLYVHIPKTGGTWVQEVLLKHGGNHVATDHQPAFREKKFIRRENLKPFCFVRHPVGYIHSVWKHWTGAPGARINNESFRKKIFHWDKRTFASTYCRNIVEGNFEQTLINFQQNAPGFVTKVYEIYSRECIYVGRYENLRDDFASFIQDHATNPSEALLADIQESPPVNVSLHQEVPKVDRTLLEAFIAAEPACQQHGYNEAPSAFIL
ncbi:hypothetical protein [Cerasicoccus frondis]|uniref:hypothetical protein n=1 Tax=Cerasicoccus frondis TaxID=490090 RepID=UPI00285261E7|nr:hypothetical protein [Cerasicoccus frondis]